MKTPTPVSAHRRNQRGIALVYFGVAMVALMAFTVIGIDIGRLAFTASEVQSAADVAATAAALAKKENSTNPVEHAMKAVHENFVDGEAADDAIESITPGRWDFGDKTFTAALTWDDPTVNAARAVGLKTVGNLVATVIGASESSVTREAIAAVGGSCTGRPVMPIALGDCFFEAFAEGDPSDPARCSSLPTFIKVPDGSDNSCFTTLTPASGSPPEEYLPEECCVGGGGGSCGSGDSPPLVRIGDDIHMSNGQSNNLYKILKSCLSQGINEWDIPIVECDNSTGDIKCVGLREVTGFAHIVITEVEDQGNPKYLMLDSICKTTPNAGSPGCNESSALSLAIVR